MFYPSDVRQMWIQNVIPTGVSMKMDSLRDALNVNTDNLFLMWKRLLIIKADTLLNNNGEALYLKLFLKSWVLVFLHVLNVEKEARRFDLAGLIVRT